MIQTINLKKHPDGNTADFTADKDLISIPLTAVGDLSPNFGAKTKYKIDSNPVNSKQFRDEYLRLVGKWEGKKSAK